MQSNNAISRWNVLKNSENALIKFCLFLKETFFLFANLAPFAPPISVVSLLCVPKQKTNAFHDEEATHPADPQEQLKKTRHKQRKQSLSSVFSLIAHSLTSTAVSAQALHPPGFVPTQVHPVFTLPFPFSPHPAASSIDHNCFDLRCLSGNNKKRLLLFLPKPITPRGKHTQSCSSADTTWECGPASWLVHRLPLHHNEVEDNETKATFLNPRFQTAILFPCFLGKCQCGQDVFRNSAIWMKKCDWRRRIGEKKQALQQGVTSEVTHLQRSAPHGASFRHCLGRHVSEIMRICLAIRPKTGAQVNSFRFAFAK